MSARSSRVSPLLVVVLLLVVTPAAVSWCPKLGDSCGIAYPCCACDPNNGGWLLHCGVVWGKGLVCTTSAFEPSCSCNSDGSCRSLSLEEHVTEALGLPRKLSMG